MQNMTPSNSGCIYLILCFTLLLGDFYMNRFLLKYYLTGLLIGHHVFFQPEDVGIAFVTL